MTTTDHPTAPGQPFVCSHCGKESFAKLEKIMDGWTCVGEALVCAFCKQAVAPPSAESDAAAATEPPARHAGLDRLASLLNETPAAKPGLEKEEGARFCRDCVNFLRHPFVSRCLLHDKPVEPMDDCDEYEPRPDAQPDSHNDDASGADRTV